ncbi:MAG: branched-chain amino acid aminotransferase [Rhodopirellula sp.]|nr:branched-chain amino acid aminotransferase [Rhodopirellula sp.]
MKILMNQLLCDDAGFVISAELVLVATIGVLSLVVGLAEISHGINQELEDVGSAFGAMQQSYVYRGLRTADKGSIVGSYFNDDRDHCDSQYDIISTAPVAEDADVHHDRYNY